MSEQETIVTIDPNDADVSRFYVMYHRTVDEDDSETIADASLNTAAAWRKTVYTENDSLEITKSVAENFEGDLSDIESIVEELTKGLNDVAAKHKKVPSAKWITDKLDEFYEQNEDDKIPSDRVQDLLKLIELGYEQQEASGTTAQDPYVVEREVRVDVERIVEKEVEKIVTKEVPVEVKVPQDNFYTNAGRVGVLAGSLYGVAKVFGSSLLANIALPIAGGIVAGVKGKYAAPLAALGIALVPELYVVVPQLLENGQLDPKAVDAGVKSAIFGGGWLIGRMARKKDYTETQNI